jgi:hypothetical protein
LGWGKTQTPQRKLFREKRRKNRQTSFDGSNPQANRNSNNESNVKGANGKNTAVSNKLVSLPVIESV